MPFSQRIRFYVIALLILGGMSALLVRLFGIQINRYDEFSKKVPGTSEVSVRIPGVRGLIRDRVGRVLVDNVARYEMQFNLKEIVDAYEAQIGEVPKTSIQRDVGGFSRTTKEDDMVTVLREVVFPQLNDIGLYEEFNAGDLQLHWRTHAGLVPYTYRDDLTFEEYAIAAEHSLDLPGVTVAARPLRRYIYDSLASHILGYVRQPDIKKVPAEERKLWTYYVPDDYGGDGIEATMDSVLRGKPGRRVLLKDEKGRIVNSKDEAGRIIGEISYEEPKSGADVWLTMDVRYQYIVEQALRDAGIGRGAAVVIAPTTYTTKLKIGGSMEDHTVYAGDVLAMVSVPSYNPNKFIPSISEVEWAAYTENKAKPLINRALKDHAPGSTFKIPVALAGAMANVDKRSYPCAGGAAYGSDVFLKCWVSGKGYTHGSIRTRNSLKHSCNGYYYRMGNAAGIRNIQKICGLMGLGEATGLPLLDEDPGNIPSPEQKRSLGMGAWGAADTAQVSIGQHQVEATPLQMSMTVATVSNGGKVYKPRLVHKIVEEGAEQREEPELLSDLTKNGVSPDQIKTIAGGLWDVVNAAGGTARRARSEIATISGKTGTAQTGRIRPNGENETNAWFVAFAPYEAPKLAVCVMVENGKSGGGVGAPVAKKIIDEIMSIEKFDYTPPLSAVKESKGNFDFLELVSFDENPTGTFVGDDDGDDGTAVAAVAAVKRKPRPARKVSRTVRKAPTVKKAPDKRGSVKPPAPPVRQARRRLFDRFRGR